MNHTCGYDLFIYLFVCLMILAIYVGNRLLFYMHITKKWLTGEEMFYFTTHSTHFIYGYMASDMVKDHSDSE